MKPYIISHMMTSVDGRIDCPMVGQLSIDEYYVALEKLGLCSKLSGRITIALESSETTTTEIIKLTGMDIWEWDKTFLRSHKVERMKITFHNRYGITHRYLTLPEVSTEDFSAAVDYLTNGRNRLNG